MIREPTNSRNTHTIEVDLVGCRRVRIVGTHDAGLQQGPVGYRIGQAGGAPYAETSAGIAIARGGLPSQRYIVRSADGNVFDTANGETGYLRGSTRHLNFEFREVHG